MALGATTESVTKMVLARGLRTTLIGIGVGIALAFAGARVLADSLYGVGPVDPVVFTLVPGVFLIVGQLASYLPARNASRADPIEVLRTE